MTATAEDWSVPFGMDRRGRGITRRRTHHDHIARVRLARLTYILEHGGRIPVWTPGPNLRTVRRPDPLNGGTV